MPSVPDVSGSARTVKSLRLMRLRQLLRRQDLDIAGQAVGGARLAARRDDARAKCQGKLRDAPADRSQAHDADGEVRHLAALERLPRPLALKLHQLRQPPADGQDHHQHVLRDRIAEDAARIGDGDAALAAAAGVNTRSTPAVAEWTHISCGQRLSSRSKIDCGIGPRSNTSTSVRSPSARPSSDTVTMREPGAASAMRARCSGL